MNIRIDYGRDGLDIEVPDEETRVLEMARTAPLQNLGSRLEEALLDPIGTPDLATLATGRKDACVVISEGALGVNAHRKKKVRETRLLPMTPLR